MNIGVIIQARMGSSRLPGKVMLQLGHKTVLGHVIERCKAITLVNNVIVATTINKDDDVIEKETSHCGANYYRGSENNVLDRYYKAAKEFNLDIIVRITSDCPLLDPAISSQIIERVVSDKFDYSSNGLNPTYPRGLDTEVFTFVALEQAYIQATKEYELEHVTPYIYQNPNLFHINSFENNIDYSKKRWTLDTLEDWKLIQEIYTRLDDPSNFSWLNILAVVEQDSGLEAINAHTKQKRLGE